MLFLNGHISMNSIPSLSSQYVCKTPCGAQQIKTKEVTTTSLPTSLRVSLMEVYTESWLMIEHQLGMKGARKSLSRYRAASGRSLCYIRDIATSSVRGEIVHPNL